ncbi:hypothetical protein ACHAXR_007462, partial [Thalassiosira sp. AJA248-18]
QLKSFLKEENGVDQYKDVEVNFISGRKAVLTIFKDGKEQEKVTLSDYNDKGKLHELFAQKGFQKYSKEEMVERRKMKENEPEKNQRDPRRMDPKLRKKQMKENLMKLKQARENFMVVGSPKG